MIQFAFDASTICLNMFELSNLELVMGNDLAIDSGIFDFGNVNFLSDLPAGLGPQTIKTEGKVPAEDVLTVYVLCPPIEHIEPTCVESLCPQLFFEGWYNLC